MIYHTLAGPSHLAIVIREFKIYDAASQRHAFKTKNFFMQDKKIICGPRGIINSVVITWRLCTEQRESLLLNKDHILFCVATLDVLHKDS